MGLAQPILDEIVRRILSVNTPDRIILFGSAAAETMTPDSDIDLMILEPSVHDPRATRGAIRQALFGLGRAFDLVVLPTEKYERSKNIIGTAAWPAAHSGKVIYESA